MDDFTVPVFDFYEHAVSLGVRLSGVVRLIDSYFEPIQNQCQALFLIFFKMGRLF
jgi:hypothetical protein